MSIILVYSTTETKSDAQRIARYLIAEHLAACVHIDEVDSLFVWNGVVQDRREYRLTVKTTVDRYDAVESAIVSQHQYQVPEIYGIALDRMYPPYEQWAQQVFQPHDPAED